MTNFLEDIITYVRRLIKTPSNTIITDNLLIDYINRFWLMDVDARIQVFDLKSTYQFQTTPGQDQYNMPLYTLQSQNPTATTNIYLLTQPNANGTANYTTNILSSILPSNPTATLQPNSIEFWLNINQTDATLYQDNGSGVITMTSGTYTISAGSINYSTGILILAFSSIPASTVVAAASFTYISGNPNSSIGMFPVYQGFEGPCYINGIEMPFYTQRSYFNNLWPNYNQTLTQAGTGNGTNGPYTLNLPFQNNPATNNNDVTSGIIRGHVDITGIIALDNTLGTGNVDPPIDVGNGNSIPVIPTTSVYSQVYFTTTSATGSNVVIADSGIFLGSNQVNGLLMTPGPAPYGNIILPNGGALPLTYATTQNTINYQTGVATNVYFPQVIPNGMPIQGQCVYYQFGIPRAALFYNNWITLRAPPDTQYLVMLNAFLTPAAFFNTAAAVPFGYMSEYIARGAARKILSDIGDWDQFNAYEPLFKEQELLVWKRSQRIWTSTRTQTIYSQDGFPNTFNNSSLGI